MTELGARQKMLTNIFSKIPGMMPSLAHQLILYYSHRDDVIMFAEAFLKYWEENGRMLFDINKSLEEMSQEESRLMSQKEIKRFHDLVVRKYNDWINFMEYDDFNKVYNRQ